MYILLNCLQKNIENMYILINCLQKITENIK